MWCRSFALVAGLVPLALGLSSCSKPYDFRAVVTLGPSIEVGDAKVLLHVARENREPEFIELSAGPPGRYEGKGGTCCAPEPQMEFFAFVDANANGAWDEGEPRGDDPNNPVRLREDDYLVEITISPASTEG